VLKYFVLRDNIYADYSDLIVLLQDKRSLADRKSASAFAINHHLLGGCRIPDRIYFRIFQ
jgi:hypothetical protein